MHAHVHTRHTTPSASTGSLHGFTLYSVSECPNYTITGTLCVLRAYARVCHYDTVMDNCYTSTSSSA